jgi:anti-sigma regulatory factor (Ser/Thr protein kinase)
VARSVHPDARVLYVDNDPMVCSHARALLADGDGVAAIQGDIRTPQAILSDPITRTIIDFTRPVGMLFVAVLHFLTDDDQPLEQVAAFRWRMANGSMLAVSHITADGTPPVIQTTIRDVYAEASAPAVFRTRREIESSCAAALPRRRGQGYPQLWTTMSPAPAPTLHPFQRASTVAAPSSWPLRSSLELGALPTAARCARFHAKHLAWEWGLAGMAETIELLVSELTTNSIQAMARQAGQPTIRLRLLTDSARVRIEVWDADPRPPAPKDPAADGTPDLEAEDGRGLFLVAALSTRWAWCATQEPMGKVTWCELDLVQLESPSEIDGSAAQPRLPRRIPAPRGPADGDHERSGYSAPTPRWAP